MTFLRLNLLLLLFCNRPSHANLSVGPSVFANGSGFGNTVLNTDGSMMVLAAPYLMNSRGGAFVIVCTGRNHGCNNTQIITAGEEGMPADLLSAGLSLSGDGVILALGAPGCSLNTGAVYIASCAAGHCVILAILASPAGKPGDVFGASLALNFDGTVLAVSADGTNNGAGAVFIFLCEGGVCNATPQKIPAPSVVSSDPLHFGRSVSFNAAGTLLAVGAPKECCNENSHNKTGLVYVIPCSAGVCGVPVKFPHEGAGGEFFGAGVAFNREGTFLAMSAHGRNRGAGVVYCGVCSANGICTYTDMFFPLGLQNFAGFGFSLSVSGDGALVVVGAPNQDSGSGVAYAFQCTPSGKCGGFGAVEFVASDATLDSYFGGGVGISADASWIVIGASNKAYVVNASSAIPQSGWLSPSPMAVPSPVPSIAPVPCGVECVSGVCAPGNGGCCRSPAAVHALMCDAQGYVTQCTSGYYPTQDRLSCAIENGAPCADSAACGSDICLQGYCCSFNVPGCTSCLPRSGACAGCSPGCVNHCFYMRMSFVFTVLGA
jgi:hypothetical protein